MKRTSASLILPTIAVIILALVHISDFQQSEFLIRWTNSVEESQQKLVMSHKLASVYKNIQLINFGQLITPETNSPNPYTMMQEGIKGIMIGEILFDQVTARLKGREAYDHVKNLKQQQQVRKNTLANREIIVGFISIVLLLLITIIINQNKIRQLKRAGKQAVQELAAYNEALIVTKGQLEIIKTQLREIQKSFEDRENQLLQAQQITEQKLLEANTRLENVNEALKKSNNELISFSYSISHDLRAPLRVINGFSTILLEEHNEKLDAGGKKALSTIQQNSNRMDELIRDLLELARLGNLALNKQKFKMQSLVENALQDKVLKPGTQLKILTLGETYGDPGLLMQVWENLVSNAIKFSSKTESPTIEIGYSQKSNEHFYWVKDNGVGFDPAYTDKLFKVFSRLHSKKEFDGTGAGLAIAKKIIDAHGGRIWAEAQLLKGATFYFTLPSS